MGRKRSADPAPGDAFLISLGHGVSAVVRVLRVGNPHGDDKAFRILWMGAAWFDEAPPSLDDSRLREILPFGHPPHHLEQPALLESLVGKPRALWWAGPPPATLTPLGRVPVSDDEPQMSHSYGNWDMITRNLLAEHAFLQDPEGEVQRWTEKYRSGAPAEPPPEPTTAEVDGAAVRIDLEANDEGVAEWVDRLPELVRAAREAAGSGAFEAVALYVEHHAAELDLDAGEIVARLRPVALWGDLEEGPTLDLSIGEDLTQYVLSVELTPDGAVADIQMES